MLSIRSPIIWFVLVVLGAPRAEIGASSVFSDRNNIDVLTGARSDSADGIECLKRNNGAQLAEEIELRSQIVDKTSATWAAEHRAPCFES